MNLPPKIVRIFLAFVMKVRRHFEQKDNRRKLELCNLFFSGVPRKRALVSYSTSSFKTPTNSKLRSSDVDLRIIIGELLGRGYEIDLVDARSEFKIVQEYHLNFGMGRPFRKLAIHQSTGLVNVLFCTEAPPHISRNNESRRCALHKTRNGVAPPTIRSDAFFREMDFALANAIIFLGDSERELDVIDVAGQETPLFPLLPSIGQTIEPDDVIETTKKARTSFVQVGTGGAIHKGTDILSETFANEPSMTLDILGHIGMERYFIRRPENVLFHGYLDMGSDQAVSLLNRAQFSILHSASEAVPTGILHSMLYGCIPVISKSCGVNREFHKFAFFLESENPRTLANELMQISETSSEDLLKRSRASQEFAMSRGTAQFRAELQETLNKIGI